MCWHAAITSRILEFHIYFHDLYRKNALIDLPYCWQISALQTSYKISVQNRSWKEIWHILVYSVLDRLSTNHSEIVQRTQHFRHLAWSQSKPDFWRIVHVLRATRITILLCHGVTCILLYVFSNVSVCSLNCKRSEIFLWVEMESNDNMCK